MELKWIVYITINLCNGKFYIGVHRTNPNVFDGYIGNGICRPSHANNGKNGFSAAVRKHGYQNFKRTIIKCFPDTEEGKKQAFELESILVNETLLKSKNVYNISPGGNGSINIDKMKRIYMFSLNGEFLQSYKSVKEASMKLSPQNLESCQKAIRNNCLNKTKSAFGYYWSYTKQFNYNKSDCFTMIAQYTIGGKFLKYFDSVSEAEIECHTSNIYQAIKNKGIAGGFQWRYYIGDCSDITPVKNLKTKNLFFPILMYEKNTMNCIGEYDSIRTCVKQNPQLKGSEINRVLKGILKSHRGFVFKYKDEDMI